MFNPLFTRLAELHTEDAPFRAVAEQIAEQVKTLKKSLEAENADPLAIHKQLLEEIGKMEDAIDELALLEYASTGNVKPHEGVTVRIVPIPVVPDIRAAAEWLLQQPADVWPGVLNVDAAAFAKLIAEYQASEGDKPEFPPEGMIIEGKKPIPAISHKYVAGIQVALEVTQDAPISRVEEMKKPITGVPPMSEIEPIAF